MSLPWTLIVALIAGALISAGFFWMLFQDLPDLIRRKQRRR